MSKRNGKHGRVVFRPTEEWREKRDRERKFEWVSLDDGSEVCVWANRVREGLAITAASTPPAALGGDGTPDEQAAMTWTVQLACHTDEPPEGELVFTPATLWAINELSPGEFGRIIAAVLRVNGASPEDAERLQAFTTRTRAARSAS